MQYVEYGRKDTIGGRVLEQEKREILYPEYRIGKKKPWQNWGVAACPIEGKAQQSSIWAGTLKSIAKKKDKQRDVRRIFKMLREVQLNIGVEKVDTHKGMTVKALLDSGATGMFIDKKMAAKHGFKLQKLDRLVMVRNIDRTNNSGGAITYQVEVNMYYKSHVERMRINICDLKRTDIILDMLWLQVYNPKINWKTGEVKMTKCPPICERKIAVKENIEKKKKVERRVRAIEKLDRDKWKMLMEEKFDNEVELDREKVKKMVLPRFYKWLKVFEKAKSERMPVKKPWDHAINLRENFMPRKERTYLMSREEKEEVREFVEEQLRKGYIRPSKSS